MKELFILFAHLLLTIAKLLGIWCDNMGRLASLAPLFAAQVEQDNFSTKLQYEGDFLVRVDGPRQLSNYTIEMGRIVSRTTTYKLSGEVRATRYTYDESARLVQVTDGTYAARS